MSLSDLDLPNIAQLPTSLASLSDGVSNNSSRQESGTPSDKSSNGSRTHSQRTPSAGKQRSKYSHPCDACSLRKIKCDRNTPCTRCIKHSLPCTNKRQRKKGGARLKKETRETIFKNASETSALVTDVATIPYFVPSITIDKLLGCLQIYQKWYYGVWPVISIAHLITKLVLNSTTSNATLINTLSSESISSYSLACAVSACVTLQVSFLSTNTDVIKLPPNLRSADLASESLRSRDFYNYKFHPSPDAIMTSFFLHMYYLHIKGGASVAKVYLREAISIAQILGLHNPNIYINKSPAETHRLRKIYYLLLVTERFMCVEDNLPVILETSLPYPSLEDEEYPSLLVGFTQLVRVFAIPDKRFFERIISMRYGTEIAPGVVSTNNSNTNSSGWCSVTWVVNVQQQLSYIQIMSEITDTQKTNILLTKYWMKALTWHIAMKNELLWQQDGRERNYSETDRMGDPSNNESLSSTFPLKIAREFLEESKGLPMFAFESNGPGVCTKLLEVGTALVDSIRIRGQSEKIDNSYIGFEYLSAIFRLISKLKNEIAMSMNVYDKMKEFLLTNLKLHSMKSRTGFISEIHETHELPVVQRRNRKKDKGSGQKIYEVKDDHINAAADHAQRPENKIQVLQSVVSNSPSALPAISIDEMEQVQEGGKDSPFSQVITAFCLPNQGQSTSNATPPNPVTVNFEETLRGMTLQYGSLTPNFDLFDFNYRDAQGNPMQLTPKQQDLLESQNSSKDHQDLANNQYLEKDVSQPNNSNVEASPLPESQPAQQTYQYFHYESGYQGGASNLSLSDLQNQDERFGDDEHAETASTSGSSISSSGSYIPTSFFVWNKDT